MERCSERLKNGSRCSAPVGHHGHHRRITGRHWNWTARGLNITQVDYDVMVRLQDGKCAICGRNEQLVPDHDHETGAVRGGLCQRCNTRLVAVEDAEWLEAALAYLSDDEDEEEEDLELNEEL